jgi:hypothetical protein
MKSFLSSRAGLITLSVLGIVALVLLAAAMKSFEFNSPLTYEQPRSKPEAVVSFGMAIDQIADVPLWKQAVFWGGMVLVTLLFSILLPPEWRKRLLKIVLRLALMSFFVLYILKNRERFGILDFGKLSLPEANLSPSPEAVPPPIYVPPQLPPITTYLVSIAVLLVLFVIASVMLRKFVPARPVVRRDIDLTDIASAARLSLQEMSAGGDWEDAIVNCYARMTDAISRRRGISREAASTPAEFALRLERSGLPAESVRRLTRLFEMVRYGARNAGERERDEASACLSDILRYCGEAA